MISGNGTFRKAMAMKAATASADHEAVLQRTLRDFDQRLEHDGQHCRFQPEQQTLDERNVAESQIDRRQLRDDHRARQHEKQPGDQPAPHAMQQPAGIGGKLHGFRAGQQHAVVQRMQEARLVEPTLLVDQDAMHQRDLAGGPAERQQADPGENARRFGKGRRRRVLSSWYPSTPPSPASCAFLQWRTGTSRKARHR